MEFPFSNQTAIVTGGTRGIGAAITDMLLAGGAAVVAIYAGNDEAAARFQGERSGASLEVVKLDVSDFAAVENFYRGFPARYPFLHILVNNAGIRRDAIVGAMPPEDWRRVIDINLTGVFNMSKFAVMAMLPGRFGRIINITSPSGRIGFPGQANYAASKAGQVAFAKSLAKETARKGITVNCVSPGFINTDFIADLDDELKKQYRSMVPLRRFGEPAEVANAVKFLASKEAAYITAAVIDVDGGL